jgi:hypothetical protein
MRGCVKAETRLGLNDPLIFLCYLKALASSRSALFVRQKHLRRAAFGSALSAGVRFPINELLTWD